METYIIGVYSRAKATVLRLSVPIECLLACLDKFDYIETGKIFASSNGMETSPEVYSKMESVQSCSGVADAQEPKDKENTDVFNNLSNDSDEEPDLLPLPYEIDNQVSSIAIDISKRIVDCCSQQLCKYYFYHLI